MRQLQRTFITISRRLRSSDNICPPGVDAESHVWVTSSCRLPKRYQDSSGERLGKRIRRRRQPCPNPSSTPSNASRTSNSFPHLKSRRVGDLSLTSKAPQPSLRQAPARPRYQPTLPKRTLLSWLHVLGRVCNKALVVFHRTRLAIRTLRNWTITIAGSTTDETKQTASSCDYRDCSSRLSAFRIQTSGTIIKASKCRSAATARRSTRSDLKKRQGGPTRR